MYLSQQQINDYQNNGAVIIKDAFKDWIEPLRNGFQKVLDKPSIHGRENVSKKKFGREKLDFLDFENFLVIFGVVVSFLKIRQFVTISDFDFKGGIFFGRPRRLF